MNEDWIVKILGEVELAGQEGVKVTAEHADFQQYVELGQRGLLNVRHNRDGSLTFRLAN